MLAKAIYDNVAEASDELAFKRGDLIEVIEQDTDGLHGWWMCEFRGQRGIAPGNRLQIIESSQHQQSAPAPTFVEPNDTYDVPQSFNKFVEAGEEEYDVPRRLPTVIPVATGSSVLQVDETDGAQKIYDIPRASNWTQEEVYDVPTSLQRTANSNNNNIAYSEEIYNIPTNNMMLNVAEIDVKASDTEGVYDVPPTVSRVAVPQQNLDEVYDVPPRRLNASTLSSNSGIGEMINVNEIYDVPSSLLQSALPTSIGSSLQGPAFQDENDVVYDVPQSSNSMLMRQFAYNNSALPAAGRSGLNSLRRMKREFNESSRYKKQQQQWQENDSYIYDVPPQVTKDFAAQVAEKVPENDDDVVDGLLNDLNLGNHQQQLVAPQLVEAKRLSKLSKSSSTSIITDMSIFDQAPLNLSLEQGLKELIELKKKVEDVVSQLLTYVHVDWRKSLHSSSSNLNEVKRAFCDILIAVKEFLEFAQGCYSNTRIIKVVATQEERAPQHVQEGFRRYLKPLKEDFKMLQKALDELESCDWDLTQLNHSSPAMTELGSEMDSIGSFVMTSRAVSDDVGQMAIYIHTHAQYIFESASSSNSHSRTTSINSFTSSSLISSPSPNNDLNATRRTLDEVEALQARPLPAVPPTGTGNATAHFAVKEEAAPHASAEWLEDYDYVALQDNDNDEGHNLSSLETSSSPCVIPNMIREAKLKELESTSPPQQQNKFGLTTDAQHRVLKLEIDIQDLMVTLSDSIKRVFESIEKGQTPKDFVGLAKAVIVSAHKIVIVGECVKEKIELRAAQDKLMMSCRSMCSTLKRTVSSTKSVALNWPSGPALQDMIDRLYDIVQCATQIKLVLYQIMPV